MSINQSKKPILCLDFDGVIHKYDSRWQGIEVITDGVTDGFFDWALKASEIFDLIIYSSRCSSDEGVKAMCDWLMEQIRQWKLSRTDNDTDLIFQFATEKPPAFLTIDDRGLTFTGNWDDFDPNELIKFRPWNKK